MANLLCGMIAVTEVIYGDALNAALLVLLAAFFDFFDGFAARLLKVQGPLGKQLDSLADMVTFGVVPGMMAFMMMGDAEPSNLKYVAFIITVASAYRLGRFNLEEGSEGIFFGLPTPVNALLWMALFFLYQTSYPASSMDSPIVQSLVAALHEPTVVLILALLSSLLCVSRIQLIALKFKPNNPAYNRLRFILIAVLIAGGVLVYLLTENTWVAVPFLLLLYLIFSVIIQSTKRNEIQS